MAGWLHGTFMSLCYTEKAEEAQQHPGTKTTINTAEDNRKKQCKPFVSVGWICPAVVSPCHSFVTAGGVHLQLNHRRCPVVHAPRPMQTDPAHADTISM